MGKGAEDRAVVWWRENREYATAKQRYLYHENRRFGLRVLRFLGCMDCGSRDERILSFDHVDARSKMAAVTQLYRGSRQKLKDEMRKCVVRCRNCHALRDWDARSFWTLQDYASGKHIPDPETLERIKSRGIRNTPRRIK